MSTTSSPGKQKEKASGASPKKSKGSTAGAAEVASNGGSSVPTKAAGRSSAAKASEVTSSGGATGTSVFPTARMQRIIKSDEELTNCSAEAAFLIAIATECFIKYFVEEAYASARLEKRKAISYKDCQRAVQREWALGFLQEAVPPTMPLSLALRKAENLEASALRGIALSASTAEAGLENGQGQRADGTDRNGQHVGMEEDDEALDAIFDDPGTAPQKMNREPDKSGRKASSSKKSSQSSKKHSAENTGDDNFWSDDDELPANGHSKAQRSTAQHQQASHGTGAGALKDTRPQTDSDWDKRAQAGRLEQGMEEYAAGEKGR